MRPFLHGTCSVVDRACYTCTMVGRTCRRVCLRPFFQRGPSSRIPKICGAPCGQHSRNCRSRRSPIGRFRKRRCRLLFVFDDDDLRFVRIFDAKCRRAFCPPVSARRFVFDDCVFRSGNEAGECLRLLRRSGPSRNSLGARDGFALFVDELEFSSF